MQTELSVGTFNCRNIKTSFTEIQELCIGCDILLLQETWLLEFELPCISKIDNDFYA